jgi:hypothetical protein
MPRSTRQHNTVTKSQLHDTDPSTDCLNMWHVQYHIWCFHSGAFDWSSLVCYVVPNGTTEDVLKYRLCLELQAGMPPPPQLAKKYTEHYLWPVCCPLQFKLKMSSGRGTNEKVNRAYTKLYGVKHQSLDHRQQLVNIHNYIHIRQQSASKIWNSSIYLRRVHQHQIVLGAWTVFSQSQTVLSKTRQHCTKYLLMHLKLCNLHTTFTHPFGSPRNASLKQPHPSVRTSVTKQ